MESFSGSVAINSPDELIFAVWVSLIVIVEIPAKTGTSLTGVTFTKNSLDIE